LQFNFSIKEQLVEIEAFYTWICVDFSINFISFSVMWRHLSIFERNVEIALFLLQLLMFSKIVFWCAVITYWSFYKSVMVIIV